jgi:hypothetical protein
MVLAKVASFNTVISGDLAAIAKLSLHEFEEIAAVTLSGVSVEVFAEEAKKWIDAAKDRRWKRPFTELTYLRMRIPVDRDHRFRSIVIAQSS